MLKCSKFRKSFDQSLYFNRHQKSKTLSLHFMQNHRKQTFINHVAYKTTYSGYTNTSIRNRALGTDQNTVVFPSCGGSIHVRENKGKKLISGEIYSTCCLKIYQLEFCLKFQIFVLNILHNLKEHFMRDFTLKKWPVCHLP